jgi:hypothetical protein
MFSNLKGQVLVILSRATRISSPVCWHVRARVRMPVVAAYCECKYDVRACRLRKIRPVRGVWMLTILLFAGMHQGAGPD